MLVVIIPVLVTGAHSTLLHIDYRPSRLVPLPRSICVGSNCMIPHYDIQGHSASVDWYSSVSGGLEISLKTLSGNEERWFIPPAVNNTSCFILSDRPADEPDDDDDFDDEDLGPSRKCIQVTKPINRWYLSKLISGWEMSQILDLFTSRMISSRENQLLLMSALLLISIWMLLCKFSKTRQRVSGLVRVSYTDPKRRSEYTHLPSRQFSESVLTPESIVRELTSKPGYSSLTIIRTSLNYSCN